jgi:hypothetical protein
MLTARYESINNNAYFYDIDVPGEKKTRWKNSSNFAIAAFVV